jgi:hypothetical protein
MGKRCGDQGKPSAAVCWLFAAKTWENKGPSFTAGAHRDLKSIT